MCGDWISLDDEVEKILKGLTAPGVEEDEPGAVVRPGTPSTRPHREQEGTMPVAAVLVFRRAPPRGYGTALEDGGRVTSSPCR